MCIFSEHTFVCAVWHFVAQFVQPPPPPPLSVCPIREEERRANQLATFCFPSFSFPLSHTHITHRNNQYLQSENVSVCVHFLSVCLLPIALFYVIAINHAYILLTLLLLLLLLLPLFAVLAPSARATANGTHTEPVCLNTGGTWADLAWLATDLLLFPFALLLLTALHTRCSGCAYRCKSLCLCVCAWLLLASRFWQTFFYLAVLF